MAWTDVLTGARQGLSDTLGRKAARREGNLQRLSDALARLNAQQYGTREREAGQEFEAGLEEARHGYRLGEIKTGLKGQERIEGQRQLFERGEREAGEEFITERDSQLHSNRLQLEKEISNLEMARLDAQIDAEVERARRLTEMQEGLYKSGSYYSDTNEQTYKWNNPREFEAAMEDMRNDAYIHRLELQGSLGQGDDAEDWVSKYIELRDDVMSDHLDIWTGQNWAGVPDEARRRRITTDFNAAIDGLVEAGQYTVEFARWAKSRFSRYVGNAALPEDLAPTHDPVDFTVEDELGVETVPQPPQGDAEELITARESDVLNDIEVLFTMLTGTDLTMAQEYARAMKEGIGEPPNILAIIDWVNRKIGTKPVTRETELFSRHSE